VSGVVGGREGRREGGGQPGRGQSTVATCDKPMGEGEEDGGGER